MKKYTQRRVIRSLPMGVAMSMIAGFGGLEGDSPIAFTSPSPISPRRSWLIICRQTVSRSQTTLSLRMREKMPAEKGKDGPVRVEKPLAVSARL